MIADCLSLSFLRRQESRFYEYYMQSFRQFLTVIGIICNIKTTGAHIDTFGVSVEMGFEHSW